MSIDVFSEMAEDTVDPVAPSDETLSRIASLVSTQLRLEEAVAVTEGDLKKLKEELNEVQLRKLPEALQSVGLSGWVSNDGSSVSVKSFVSAHISESHKEEAHTWLRDNGDGAMIKHIASVELGQNEETISAVHTFLNKSQVPYLTREAVHVGTLKSWLKKKVADGEPVPLELFGAFLGSKSVIKRGKTNG